MISPCGHDARRLRLLTVCAVMSMLAACASTPAPSPSLTSAGARLRAYNRPYQVRGRWYVPAMQPHYDAVGLASWYSYESASRTTADGEVFDARLATAAHTTLPLPSYIEVTNLDNGRRLRLRVNDRGPFASGRILDVTRGAADQLGFLGRGTARVRVRYLGPAPGGRDNGPLIAQASSRPRRETVQPAALDDPAAEVEQDAADSAPMPAPYVSASPRSSEPMGEPPAEPEGRYAIQAGAFSDPRNAQRAAARLAVTGSTVIRPMQGSRGLLYRVMVGGWPSEDAARAALSQVAEMGFADAAIVAR